MQKIVLVSILVVTLACPMAAARTASARLALRRAVWWTLAGIAGYALAVMFVYPRLVTW
jgi:hypothetical protein